MTDAECRARSSKGHTINSSVIWADLTTASNCTDTSLLLQSLPQPLCQPPLQPLLLLLPLWLQLHAKNMVQAVIPERTCLGHGPVRRHGYDPSRIRISAGDVSMMLQLVHADS